MACLRNFPQNDGLVESSADYLRQVSGNGLSTSDGDIPSGKCPIRHEVPARKSASNLCMTKLENGIHVSRCIDPATNNGRHESDEKRQTNGTVNGNHESDEKRRTNGVVNGTYEPELNQTNGVVNGNHEPKQHKPNGITNGNYEPDQSNGVVNGKYESEDHMETPQKTSPIPKGSTYLRNSNGIVETDSLTADVLSDLFSDKICVLCVKNYASTAVCEKLDSFLRDKGSDQYTHEIRKDGRADLIYFGVNRYGYPLNSTYNDPSGQNLGKYLTEALPTIRSIRQASHPYLSPIDKFRVEMDEAWPMNVNVASLQGQKTFCGIGRIMPASLSELSADQPHFDAVPTSYFPQIHKQFTANFYLNVPESGGELEIWDVSPISIENIENFTIPKNWRGTLPDSIKVKPEQGDLLLFNTRRPHAITSFGGSNPRTSIQTFIGLAKNSEVFLWV